MCGGNRFSYIAIALIAQANQKAVVSIASMQNMLLLGDLGACPP